MFLWFRAQIQALLRSFERGPAIAALSLDDAARLFHADSYGCRPGKSAMDAVGQAGSDAGVDETRDGAMGGSLYRAPTESANARG